MNKIKYLALMSLITPVCVTQAMAETAPAQASSGLEEIVVTAQKRAENLQNVPLAITAITAKAVEASGIRSSEDLGLAIPGISVTRTSTAAQVFLRGIGTDSGQAGQEAAIAIFVDGVYQPSVSGATFSLNNIERIEALKGPQGTLYGRNATGGAINVVTKDPSHTTQLKAELGYGNKQTTFGNFYASTGLTDTVAIDLAGFGHWQSKGFGRNTTTGHEVNKSDEFAIRSKLLFEPTDATRIVLGGDYSKMKGSIGMAQRPGDLSGNPLGGGGFYDTQGDIDGHLSVKNKGVNLKVEQDLSFGKLTSITAYRALDVFQDGDLDLTPFPIVEYPLTETNRQFTQEFNLGGESESLKWIVGLFYLNGKTRYDPFQLLGWGIANPACLADFSCTPDTIEDGFAIRAMQKTQSYAGYGQLTYTVAEGTHVTVGGRYTSDTRKATASFYMVDDRALSFVYDYTPAKKTFKKATWRFAVDHQFTPDAMAYASYSRGFKSGLYNLIAVGATQFPDPVSPEVLDAFEVGFKSSMFDRRVRLNLSTFYYKYKNMQVSKITNGGTQLLNAADSTIFGVDGELDVALNDQFTLHGGFSYLPTAKYDNFLGAPIWDGTTNSLNPGDAGGNRLLKAPKTTINIALNHKMPLAGGELASNLTYAYNSGFFWSPDNQPRQHAFSLVNAQIRWTAPGEHFYVRAFAKNAFNKKYLAQNTEVTPFGLTDSPAAGRTFGAALGIDF